ncbi:hypothetical protein GCM10020331_004220 [Ectobacillus funiculus]
MIKKNAFIRVADASNQVELIHYNITDNFSGLTSLFAGEIYRHGGEWKFFSSGTRFTRHFPWRHCKSLCLNFSLLIILKKYTIFTEKRD